MRLARSFLLTAVLAGGASFAGVIVPSDAQASVSIAVGYDALVQDADSIGVITPTETKSVWEDGRIYTYTRVKVEQGVAGEMGTGGEAWIRTMGGVVGKIGQMVDGEPVFTTGKSTLTFLRKFKGVGGAAAGTWEVSARAQGQYPVVTEENAQKVKIKKVTRSAAVGVLYPPKAVAQPAGEPQPGAVAPAAGPPTAAGAAPQTYDPKATATEVGKIRLAGEVLHDRPLDEVTREIAASWKRLHPSDAKK